MDQQVLTLVQIRWLRLGLFQTIRLTIKYKPGKANVVVVALSWSQPKMEEGSTDNSTATVAVGIKAQILALSGVSMELIAKDLQRWTPAYKEHKAHIVVYMKLYQGQKYEDLYLPQSGLMARMMNDR